jgi:protein TonB
MATLFTFRDSFDDLVFEGRNQAYGAFQLRQSYQRHLGSALFIAIAACTVLFLTPVAVRYFLPEEVVERVVPKDFPPIAPGVYEMPKFKPVPPAATHPTVTVTPHSAIQTRVAPDAEVKPTVQTALPPDVGAVGPATVGAPNTTGTSAGVGPATAPGVDSARPAPEVAPAAVLYAEVMPDFVGGRSALQRYLQKHLRFPAAALAAQVSGRVFVSFVVQTDGSIGEVTVLKGLGYGTDEAAARVVREMPAWVPGMQNHRAVPVRFTLPISFQYE